MLKSVATIVISILALLTNINCQFGDDELEYLNERLGFCANNFQYVNIGDASIGKLTLPNLKMGDTVKAQFFYHNLGFGDPFQGSLLPDESSEEILKRLEKGQTITYRIDFPITTSNVQLEIIFINDEEFCGTIFGRTNERPEKLILRHTLEVKNGAITVFEYNIHVPYFAKSTNCGLPDVTASDHRKMLSQNGTVAYRGEYPWLVAIFRKQSTGMAFICSGTLLSTQIVLTVAHCAQGLRADEINLQLGRYDLSGNEEPDVVEASVEYVIIHPEYKKLLSFSDADLALLKLRKPVSFTNFIKPICLWSENVAETLITDHIAIIAGWTLITEGDQSTASLLVPRKVRENIVSESECINSSPLYNAITQARTFCAENADDNGTIACTERAGSPLMLKRYGRWMLRGMLSTGLTTKEDCALQSYSIYYDLAKHLPWLESYLEPTTPPIRGKIQDICGNTSLSTPGQYPWIVAIYKKMNHGELFVCSGSLISSRNVLAPAHCFDTPWKAILAARFFRIYFGRYNLSQPHEDGVIRRDVTNMLRHPKYKFSFNVFYDNDFMLLQLSEPVSFTQKIQPICLWNEPADQLQGVGLPATLIGWDTLRVYNASVTVPLAVEANVVSMRRCQHEGYYADTSARFMCAPHFGNVVDGILMMQRKDQWFLRGQISVNLFYGYIYESREFRVYSDITDYVSWIKRNMLL